MMREFNLVHSEWQFPASFNVAPSQNVPVIRSIEGQPHGSLMRWGLIPFFARGLPPKYSTINARVETVPTAASYRGPWSRGQRCLQVATGFYEWRVQVVFLWFAIGGVAHCAATNTEMRIVPPYIPWPHAVELRFSIFAPPYRSIHAIDRA
jgi:hypothetical protein